jgi:hypothetical protein
VWSASRPVHLYPEKDPVPIVKEAGWAPEPVWIGAQHLAPLGFDPWTFQPVASHYTDYANSASINSKLYMNCIMKKPLIHTVFEYFNFIITLSPKLV